jgi:hypothetical protein
MYHVLLVLWLTCMHVGLDGCCRGLSSAATGGNGFAVIRAHVPQPSSSWCPASLQGCPCLHSTMLLQRKRRTRRMPTAC